MRRREWSTKIRTSKQNKAKVVFSIKELYWAAGFLEGEGSFHRNHIGLGSTERVNANQVNREPLRRLLNLFGGTLYNKRERRDNRQPISAWGIYGARARGAMMTLYLLMSKRRKAQIRKALATPKARSIRATSTSAAACLINRRSGVRFPGRLPVEARE